jgi:sugar phosphate permease
VSTTEARSRRERRWAWTFVALLVVIVVIVGLWLAHAGSNATSVPAATCQTITGTLANGPDPDADPIGHAQAQIVPLQKIPTTNAGLKDALTSLSSAYATYVKDDGSKASRQGVALAARQLDTYCPGAAA